MAEINYYGPVPTTPGNMGSDPTAPPLGLMRDLEASLHRSRQALLAFDLAGMEYETGEQRRMVGKLSPLLRRSSESGVVQLRSSDDVEAAFDRDGGLGAAYLSSAKAILEAARLQTALLRRAQSKMRVLANMLAGSSVTYGSLINPAVRNAASFPVKARECSSGDNSCRA
jgi:hypothetical protein